MNLKYDLLPEADQEAIRQVMLKQTVRIVKHQLPNESGKTCHAIAWDLVEKALKAERNKQGTYEADAQVCKVHRPTSMD